MEIDFSRESGGCPGNAWSEWGGLWSQREFWGS
uniref:Uncharacterized protein n=1 Tax=Anguilla anguilla TaxID=7936 RepID=A0A0E9VT82_ANGAN